MSTPAPPRWLTADLVLLDERCPLPLDRPYLAREAAALGVSKWYHRILVRRGLVREVVRGVYAVSQLTDTIELRAAALRLVTPDHAVITDRTASWVHGVDVLGGSAVHERPPIDMFDRAGSRVRRPGVDSGIRTLLDTDITEIEGLRVTTPLRTALDLGRRLWRYDAIAALDGLLRVGVDPVSLAASVDRFRGHRGVVQLRELVPLADPRAESPPESALRLHWIESGLPAPQPQVCVTDETGATVFRIDLGLEECRFGAEYKGVRFHTGDETVARDEAREAWLAERGWTLVEFWKDDVYGVGATPDARLWEGLREARSRLGGWRPQGRFL